AWALEGGYLQFVARLKDPATRSRVVQAMRVGDGSSILLRQIPSATLKQFERKRLSEIAAAMQTHPAEAALRLFEESISSPIGIYFGLNEDDMQYALRQPWVAIGSDSGAVVGVMRDAGAHPRAYGTFPCVAANARRGGARIEAQQRLRFDSMLRRSVPGRDGLISKCVRPRHGSSEGDDDIDRARGVRRRGRLHRNGIENRDVGRLRAAE